MAGQESLTAAISSSHARESVDPTHVPSTKYRLGVGSLGTLILVLEIIKHGHSLQTVQRCFPWYDEKSPGGTLSFYLLFQEATTADDS
jgi:hypothetical protein